MWCFSFYINFFSTVCLSRTKLQLTLSFLILIRYDVLSTLSFSVRSSFSVHDWKFNRVLDNLKDYAVRALVNAVDHLGTVAYKLTDLVEQQTLDVSTTELKVSCLNQVYWVLPVGFMLPFLLLLRLGIWFITWADFLSLETSHVSYVHGDGRS